MAVHAPKAGRQTFYKRRVCAQSPQNKKLCKRADSFDIFGIPEDVVYLVLMWLPVRDLLRLRCVSKGLNEMLLTRSFNMDLLKVQSRREEEQEHTSLLFRMISNVETRCNTLVRLWGDCQNSLRLDFPVCSCEDVWMSTYSCDGIFCLICEKPSSYSGHPHQIVLWNPLTGRYRGFPWPTDVLHRYYGVNTFVGFGYDPRIRDYKIVVVCFPPYEDESTLIKVRTLKSNVWTTVQVSITCRMFREYGILEPIGVGEDIYWIGNNLHVKSLVILKFNLVQEKLTTIIPPHMDKRNFIKLGKFNGSLYAYAYGNSRVNDEKLVEVWKHTKYESITDWEKEFIITKGSMPRDFESVESLEPLGFTRSGNFLINVENVLHSYLPQEDICVEVKINEDILPKNKKDIYCQIHLLDTETLISP